MSFRMIPRRICPRTGARAVRARQASEFPAENSSSAGRRDARPQLLPARAGGRSAWPPRRDCAAGAVIQQARGQTALCTPGAGRKNRCPCLFSPCAQRPFQYAWRAWRIPEPCRTARRSHATAGAAGCLDYVFMGCAALDVQGRYDAGHPATSTKMSEIWRAGLGYSG
jgi:hypothetical protein